MSKIKVSEVFYSVQGEGLWTGVPSVFLRTFGCNFNCRGFAMPKGELTDEPEQIAKDIDKYPTYEDLPLAKTGCDSYASWHPSFKHLSPLVTIDALAEQMVSLLPEKKWTQANGQDIHLVITGGEPLLGWQRSYVELLCHPLMQDLKNLTFETNATQILREDLIRYFEDRPHLHVTWSCSPKLSVSGEKREAAIRPEIVKQYNNRREAYSDLYLKFVITNEDDLADVEWAVEQYRVAGVNCPVYLMPVGGTTDTYQFTSKDVAKIAIDKGYRYSARLQLDLFGNAWGT